MFRSPRKIAKDMKYSVNYYKNGSDAPRYVASVEDYKNGGMCDPVLMDYNAAVELVGRLVAYVEDEYIGTNDEENRRAHDAFSEGEWGFDVEGWQSMGE